MDRLKITGCASALADSRVDNETLCQNLETDPAWIEARTGIRARRHLETLSLEALTAEACRGALEQAGRDPQDIDVLVCATCSSEKRVPSLASRAARLLHLPEHVLCFDVNAACCGFLDALHAAGSLLQPGQKALVAGAEQLSALTDFRDRNTAILFGDGAGAVVLEETGAGPAWYVHSFTPDENHLLETIPDETGQERIRMKGREVFRYAVETLPRLIEEVTEKSPWNKEDICLVVPHQANARILHSARQRLQLEEDRFLVCLDETGNTSAASLPMALAEAQKQGKLKKGKPVVLAAFGAGLCAGAVLFAW